MARRGRTVGLFGEFGVGNVGNDTSLRTTIEILGEFGLDASFEIITRGSARASRTFGLPAIAMKSEAEWFEARQNNIAVKVVRRLWDVVRIAFIVGRYRAILVPGTGLLEASRSSSQPSGTINALALLAVAARIRRVPIIWFAAGGGRYSGRLTPMLVKVGADGAARRSFRDELTKAEIQATGAKVAQDPVVRDVVFAYRKVPSVTAGAGDAPVVAVAVIDIPRRSITAGEFESDRSRYIGQLIQLCSTLRNQGNRIKFILGDEADDQNTQSVLAGLGWTDSTTEDTVSYARTTNFDQILAELADVDAVIASRYHIIIAASIMRRPTIAISHAAKIVELMDGLGMPGFIDDIYTFDAEAVGDLLKQGLADGPALSDQLKRLTQANRLIVESELRHVAKLLERATGGGPR